MCCQGSRSPRCKLGRRSHPTRIETYQDRSQCISRCRHLRQSFPECMVWVSQSLQSSWCQRDIQCTGGGCSGSPTCSTQSGWCVCRPGTAGAYWRPRRRGSHGGKVCMPSRCSHLGTSRRRRGHTSPVLEALCTSLVGALHAVRSILPGTGLAFPAGQRSQVALLVAPTAPLQVPTGRGSKVMLALAAPTCAQ